MTNFERLLRTLGRNIYRARSNQRLTQQGLADLSRLPRSTLSLIESGRSNPSLQSLARVSEALKVNINELISTPKNFAWEILDSDITKEEFDNGKVRTWGLLPKEVTSITLQHIEVDALGTFFCAPKTEFSKEFLTVLEGKLLLRLANSSISLKAGEAVHFRCDQSYSYENVSEEPARAIAAVLPISISAHWQ